MASLRQTLPRLLHQIHTPSPTTLLRHTLLNNAPSKASTSASLRRALSTTPSRTSPHLPPSSPFANLAKRFTASANTSRGVSTSPVVRPGQTTGDSVDWTAVATRVGLAAVAAVGLNYALNRETRSPLSAYEADYLHSTFLWTGAGLAITTAVAKLLHSNGVAVRFMSLNPWVAIIGGAALSIGSMMGVYYTAPDSPAHYAAWATFAAVQGLTLSPMFFLNPAVLSRAGLYTAGSMAGLCYVGATAQSEQFLFSGGALMCGLGVLVAASLAPMLLPRMTARTMTMLEYGTAYGGVALFSGFILYDTQKILKHAQLAQRGAIPRDPIRESVSLIIDAINLFVRMVQVMMLQQGGRRK